MDNTWNDLTSCNSTSYHVQNLLGDRQYKFRVRAVNVYGVGEPSAESEPIKVGVEEITGENEHLLNREIRSVSIDRERISGLQKSEATRENAFILQSFLFNTNIFMTNHIIIITISMKS